MTGGGGVDYSSGADCCSFRGAPAAIPEAAVAGPITWAYEPAKLGLTACASGPHDTVGGLNSLLSTSAHLNQRV